MDTLRTISHLFDMRAEQHPQKTFLYFKDAETSYPQLSETASNLANSRTGIGVQKGDKVCVYMTNCVEYIQAFFGITRAGDGENPEKQDCGSIPRTIGTGARQYSR